MKWGFLKFVKRYHLLHHFRTPEHRFGVSFLWDYIFGTGPKDSYHAAARDRDAVDCRLDPQWIRPWSRRPGLRALLVGRDPRDLHSPVLRREFLTQLHFALVARFDRGHLRGGRGTGLAIQLVREMAQTGVSAARALQVIAVVRALGPVLTGMVVASRMSAGITAELAAMRSSDQIDALVAFGSDPMKRLVVPRVAALMIALPVLGVIGDALAVAGGGLVGLQYHLPLEAYYSGVLKYLTPKEHPRRNDQPFIFAAMISTVACWRLPLRGGRQGRGGLDHPSSSSRRSESCHGRDLHALIFRILGW